MAVKLKALADPVRLQLFSAIASHAGGEACVCDISVGVEVSQPTVSHHLKVLRDAGFASVRRDGARRLYAVESQPLREVDAWLDRFRRFWEHKLDALATEVARGKRRRPPTPR